MRTVCREAWRYGKYRIGAGWGQGLIFSVSVFHKHVVGDGKEVEECNEIAEEVWVDDKGFVKQHSERKPNSKHWSLIFEVYRALQNLQASIHPFHRKQAICMHNYITVWWGAWNTQNSTKEPWKKSVFGFCLISNREASVLKHHLLMTKLSCLWNLPPTSHLPFRMLGTYLHVSLAERNWRSHTAWANWGLNW